MAERANSYNVTLYPEDIRTIKNHKKNAHFKYEAEALRDIIHFHKKNYQKTFIKNILTFVGFPAIIGVILYLVSNKLFSIHHTMVNNGLILEYPEITLNIYQLGSSMQVGQLATTAFIVASIILFTIQTRKQR
jgi:hypothetical protein